MNKTLSQIRRNLAQNFGIHEVVWRVTAISADSSACEFSPLVRISAYHRRLTSVFGKWSYSLRFLPESSDGDNKQFIAECVLDLPEYGRFCGLGKIPAGMNEASVRSQAKAFQSACIEAGVGKQLRSIWTAVNKLGEPKCLPMVPPNRLVLTNGGVFHASSSQSDSIASNARNLEQIKSILRLRNEIGESLYKSVLSSGLTLDFPEMSASERTRLLRSLKSVAGKLREVKRLASTMPDYILYDLLEEEGLRSLFEIRSVELLERFIMNLRQRFRDQQWQTLA